MTPSQSNPHTFDILQINRKAAARTRMKQARSLIAGGLLVGLGAARRSWFGLLLAAYGVELLVEGLTERPLTHHLQKIWREQNPSRRRFGNGTRDRVDEASWESFPASDPSGAP
jgi:hypothetical protein